MIRLATPFKKKEKQFKSTGFCPFLPTDEKKDKRKKKGRREREKKNGNQGNKPEGKQNQQHKKPTDRQRSAPMDRLSSAPVQNPNATGKPASQKYPALIGNMQGLYGVVVAGASAEMSQVRLDI